MIEHLARTLLYLSTPILIWENASGFLPSTVLSRFFLLEAGKCENGLVQRN